MSFCDKRVFSDKLASMDDIQDRIHQLSKIFSCKRNAEERYMQIIELGKDLSPYPKELITQEHLVAGCQSILYFASRDNEEKITFFAQTDALISRGLAAVLIYVYSNELPEIILKTSPNFLSDLGILGALSPSRSNGLAKIHQRIKQDAVLCLKRISLS